MIDSIKYKKLKSINMNLLDNHSADKSVSTKVIFNGEGVVISLKILANQKLAEHFTKIPAMLICISGDAVFEYVDGEKYYLKSGDYVNIDANRTHWIIANVDSQFILAK